MASFCEFERDLMLIVDEIVGFVFDIFSDYLDAIKDYCKISDNIRSSAITRKNHKSDCVIF